MFLLETLENEYDVEVPETDYDDLKDFTAGLHDRINIDCSIKVNSPTEIEVQLSTREATVQKLTKFANSNKVVARDLCNCLTATEDVDVTVHESGGSTATFSVAYHPSTE